MDFATRDFLLAGAHHLCVFALFGVLAAEWAMLRPGLSATVVRRLGRIDLWYGLIAGLVLVAGFSRAVWAAKGWDAYMANPWFHAKLGVFLVVGVISIWPTLEFRKWRRALKTDASALPTDARVAWMRRLLGLQLGMFLLIPLLAAGMARQFGT